MKTRSFVQQRLRASLSPRSNEIIVEKFLFERIKKMPYIPCAVVVVLAVSLQCQQSITTKKEEKKVMRLMDANDLQIDA